MDLSRVKDRQALLGRREPHWQRLHTGCFVGYRPSTSKVGGTWIARAYDADRLSYRLKTLGDLGSLPPRERFQAAKGAAEEFARMVEAGGFVEDRLETVEDACRRYAVGREDVQGRFQRHVYGDPIAKMKLVRLRRHHLYEWRRRLEQTPAMVTRRKKGPNKYRPRAPASVNRDMAMIRAALNRVLAPGTPDSEAAWQEALRPIRNAGRQRTLYLDKQQRRSLLQKVEASAEPFVRALCLLPLRPGAVAQLTAGDFDVRTSELTIGKDKSGKPRRILIPREVARLFASQAKGKPSAAPLIARPNGKPWDRSSWKLPIAKAAREAELPAAATAYTLRHSTITDLVNGGLPLLTVAQISDTSVEMIERHYGHLCRHAAVEALSALAL